jgi:hypothetical protein
MRERGATNLIGLENDTTAPKFVVSVTATVHQAGTPVTSCCLPGEARKRSRSAPIQRRATLRSDVACRPTRAPPVSRLLLRCVAA